MRSEFEVAVPGTALALPQAERRADLLRMHPHPPMAVIPTRLLALTCAACMLASCGDAVAPVVPVATTITTSTATVGFSSLAATSTVTAVVLDQTGAAMPSASVTWSSDEPAVVTVSSGGVITSVGNGSTTVRASSGDAEAEVAVSVAQAVATLELLDDSVSLKDPGDASPLLVQVLDALGSNVPSAALAWSSSDPAIASVDSTGLVTAVATGTVSVVVVAGALSDTVRVTVEPELMLLAVGAGVRSGAVASDVALSARVTDVDGNPYPGATVTWTIVSGTGAIVSSATVSSDEGGYAGAVWRFGTQAGSQQARATIETRGRSEVVDYDGDAAAGPAVRAAMTADTVLLSARGETAFLAPAYFDEYDNVTTSTGTSWSVDDASIATVSTTGLVTGMDEGTTWVRLGLGSVQDSVEITVAHRGAITVTFDDGWRTVYENAWPLFQEFDIRGNIGVYTEAVGFPAYMTEAHLDELHDAGWSMASHTVSHDTLTTLSAGDLDYELRASQQWLVDRGYRGTNVLIVPYHEFEEPERIAASAYYTAARGKSANEFTPDSLVSWMPSNPYLLRGIDAESLPYTTVAGRDRLRTLLQRTADEGAFLDVYFHMIPPENVAALRATLEVLDEFRERVLPYHELYPIWARSVF